MSIEVGIAIGQETPIDKLIPYMESVDFVQCMGIEKIGRQHEPFDERTFERVKTLREKYPALIISIDGGVSGENAEELARCGVNRLVSGSYIYESENPKEAIEKLVAVSS